MSLDLRRHRDLLRSLWRRDGHRSDLIDAENRAERRRWKAALRRGDEPREPPRPVGRRSLEVAPLTLRALTRWAFHAGLRSRRFHGFVPQDERLAAVLALLPADRLRAAARRHLRGLDAFSTDTWGPWHARGAGRLARWLQRRMRRYQAAIPTRYSLEPFLGRPIDMLGVFADDPALCALFNERLARAHRPPDQGLRWHPWVDGLFRAQHPDLGLSPPRLLGREEARLTLPWHASSPEFELYDELWAGRHRRRRICLSSPARTGKHPDPRFHPEGWAVMERFFELWRAGVRDERGLREATATAPGPERHDEGRGNVPGSWRRSG